MSNAVYIDSGHGGSDPGSIGNGIVERDINARIAKALVAALRRSGIRTYTDLEIGNPGSGGSVPDSRKHPDVKLFVSQHHNAFSKTTARGFETYKTGTGRSLRFAKVVHARLLTELRKIDVGYVDRKIKEAIGTRAEYIVTRSQGASILLENGFLTNANDAKVIKRSDYVARCAETVAKAIIDFGRAEKLWTSVYKAPVAAPTLVTAYAVFHANGASHGRFKSLDTAMSRARTFVVNEGGTSVKRGKYPPNQVQ